MAAEVERVKTMGLGMGKRGRCWPSNARSRTDPTWDTPEFGLFHGTSARAPAPGLRVGGGCGSEPGRRSGGRSSARALGRAAGRLLLVVGSGGVGGAFEGGLSAIALAFEGESALVSLRSLST